MPFNTGWTLPHNRKRDVYKRQIYIPLGATHCLENPGKIPLDLIEVRSGSYLEEDDVVRFADRYGRV